MKRNAKKVCNHFFPRWFSGMCQSKNVKPYILYECILSLSCIWHIFLYIMWMPYTQKSYSNEGFYICLAIYALSHVKKRLFVFWIFLINKKVLRMYEAYYLFNLTKNIIVIFSILGLLSHFTNIIWFSHIFPKKGKPNFWKFFHIYGKLVYLTFFYYF